jgi:hypothetical protein
MTAIPFPELSPAFTVEDIRKIRDWNSERYAVMTHREIADEINSGAREFETLIENARQLDKREAAAP